MQKELEILEMEYSKNDQPYINEMIAFLETNWEEISQFFDRIQFVHKIKMKIWSNVDDFRAQYPWQVGVTVRKNGRNYIHVLTFDEYKKTEGHFHKNLNDYKLLLMHEIVHAYVKEFGHNHGLSITSENTYAWLQEGMATKLSHQYDDHPLLLKASLEEIRTNTATYNDYYTLFSYVLNTYGSTYVKSLILDFDKLKVETPKLYREAKHETSK